METIAQVIGWIGTFLIILAYFLNSSKKIDSSSKIYQAINLLGAFCVGINVLYQQAWPALALQIVWGIIAVVSLVKSNYVRN